MSRHNRSRSVAANALDHMSTNGKIEWLASLDTEYHPEKNLRRSSIICTIGPKTNSVEAINKLRTAGLNVVRMNFSHGSYEYHQSVIDNARAAEKSQIGRPVAIALDTKGMPYSFRPCPVSTDVPPNLNLRSLSRSWALFLQSPAICLLPFSYTLRRAMLT